MLYTVSKVSRLFFTLLLLSRSAYAVVSAADIAKQIQEAGLDPAECYRVIDQSYAKPDVRIFFTSGYMIFTRPVNGIRTAAVFTTEVESGDGEVLVLPPVRSERLSLVNFADTPNLDEHFRYAVLLATDNSAEELLAILRASGAKKVPEMGALLAEQWSPVVSNLSAGLQVRQVEDILSGQPKSGLFYMNLKGAKLGSFDVICDPKAEENVLIGQLGEQKGRTYFNVWTSFASKSRQKSAPVTDRSLDMTVDNFRIDATLGQDLVLKANTRFTGTVREPSRAFAFTISQRMRVLDATIDGQPAEVFQRDSLRSGLIRQRGPGVPGGCSGRPRSRQTPRIRDPARRCGHLNSGRAGLLCRLAVHLVSAARHGICALRADVPVSQGPGLRGHGGHCPG